MYLNYRYGFLQQFYQSNGGIIREVNQFHSFLNFEKTYIRSSCSSLLSKKFEKFIFDNRKPVKEFCCF